MTDSGNAIHRVKLLAEDLKELVTLETAFDTYLEPILFDTSGSSPKATLTCKGLENRVCNRCLCYLNRAIRSLMMENDQNKPLSLSSATLINELVECSTLKAADHDPIFLHAAGHVNTNSLLDGSVTVKKALEVLTNKGVRMILV